MVALASRFNFRNCALALSLVLPLLAASCSSDDSGDDDDGGSDAGNESGGTGNENAGESGLGGSSATGGSDGTTGGSSATGGTAATGGSGAEAGTASNAGGSGATPGEGGVPNSASGTTGASDDGGMGGASETPVVVGDGLLIYHGDGGFEEDAFGSGSVQYRDWVEIAAPLRGDVSEEWPEALDPYGTIVLVAPGARQDEPSFSRAHQDLLAAWTAAGGTLVLLQDYNRAYGDNDVAASNLIVNDFLERMNVPIAIDGSLINRDYVTIDSSHPLAEGLTSLSCAYGDFGEMSADPPAEVIGTVFEDIPGIAVAAVGEGNVVVFGDLDCLSDWMPTDASEQMRENILALRED